MIDNHVYQINFRRRFAVSKFIAKKNRLTMQVSVNQLRLLKANSFSSFPKKTFYSYQQPKFYNLSSPFVGLKSNSFEYKYNESRFYSNEVLLKEETEKISIINKRYIDNNNNWIYVLLGITLGFLINANENINSEEDLPGKEKEVQLINWSGNHIGYAKNYYTPKNEKQIDLILKYHHLTKIPLRPIGSNLSPNGLGFSSEGGSCINIRHCDRIIHIDKELMQVTVQAGITVHELTKELKKHNLILQNFASIKDQQLGGFLQVGAHGTGALIPPVDEQIIRMKLITPAKGAIELSKEKNGDLFQLCKVGLGCFGIVSEVTLQCVPLQLLVEETKVLTMKEVLLKHKLFLKVNRHLKYMWIPYTDSVVVVTVNPVDSQLEFYEKKRNELLKKNKNNLLTVDEYDEVEIHELSKQEKKIKSIKEAIEIYNEKKNWDKKCKKKEKKEKKIKTKVSDIKSSYYKLFKLKNFPLSEREMALPGSSLRDTLYAIDPLNPEWIKLINQADADYWSQSQGYRVGTGDELLEFDCGGQQLVLETAFKAGTIQNPNLSDMNYILELYSLIKEKNIPAHSPIEQRWTSSSESIMSPAYHKDPALFSWVGIIMYLPFDNDESFKEVDNHFQDFTKNIFNYLIPKYRARVHWAKLELPQSEEELEILRSYVLKSFPVQRFNEVRKELDPHSICSNTFINTLFNNQ